jgi:competence protein ComEC
VKGLWAFAAISSLLVVVLVLENGSYIPLILSVIWLIRLCFSQNKQVIVTSLMIASMIGSLAIIRCTSNKSSITIQETSFLVSVKQTSFQINGDLIQFQGQVETKDTVEKVMIRYRLHSEEEKEEWMQKHPPDWLMIQGQLIEPTTSRNFYQFDYAQYLRRQNVYWTIEAEELKSVEIDNLVDQTSIFYQLDAARAKLLYQIDRRLPSPTADYVKAILFADRRSLSPEVIEQFRSIGIIHLLSISGLHIQFLIVGIRRFLLRTGLTIETTDWILLFFLPIYGTFAGWGVSVFRAIIQSMLALLCSKCNRPQESSDYWSLTLLLALCINPYSVYSIGFQLSYLLSGILIFTQGTFSKEGNQSWKNILLISCLINFASIPILTYHYYEFPWITLLANLLFIPIFTWSVLPLLIGISVLSLFFEFIPFLEYSVKVSQYALRFLEGIVSYFERLPQASIITGRLSLLPMCLLGLSIWLIVYSIERSRKKLYLAIGFLTFSFSLMANRFSPFGRVVMLDVGQGESILIQQPFGKGNYLIDTGGQVKWRDEESWRVSTKPFDLGKDVVVPSLKALGVSQLDQIYLTHADADHTEALSAVIEEIPTREVVALPTTFLEENIMNDLSILLDHNVEIHPIKAPVSFENGLTLIYPLEVTGNGKNEDSLVFYGKIGDYYWLFTGDLEESGERKLLALYPSLRVDVLNVAHHGSNTSTHEPFLNHIQPQIAWISSGRNNSYGHPHPDVIDRLEQQETTIYRTDQQGAILYKYSDWAIFQRLLEEEPFLPHIEKQVNK